MKNLNPLYEINTTPVIVSSNGANNMSYPPSSPQQNSGMTFGQGLALTYGAGAVTGAASKYLKDRLLIKKILRDYPTPMSFKNALYRLPGQGKDKTALLVKLQPNTSQEDYIKLLKTYVCHGTTGRYIMNALGSVFSTAGNLSGMADNASNTTNDAINLNVLSKEL